MFVPESAVMKIRRTIRAYQGMTSHDFTDITDN